MKPNTIAFLLPLAASLPSASCFPTIHTDRAPELSASQERLVRRGGVREGIFFDAQDLVDLSGQADFDDDFDWPRETTPGYQGLRPNGVPKGSPYFKPPPRIRRNGKVLPSWGVEWTWPVIRDLDSVEPGQRQMELGKRSRHWPQMSVKDVDGREPWTQTPKSDLRVVGDRHKAELQPGQAVNDNGVIYDEIDNKCPDADCADGEILGTDAKRASFAKEHRLKREGLHKPFTSFAIKPEMDRINLKKLQAHDGKIWLGGEPGSKCPVDVITCPDGNTTAFWVRGGRAWLDAAVPGGQYLYIAGNGALLYYQAPSDVIGSNVANSGFKSIEGDEEIPGHWWFGGDGATGFVACPAGDAWQVFVNTKTWQSFFREDCIPFDAMTRTYSSLQAAAWEYD